MKKLTWKLKVKQWFEKVMFDWKVAKMRKQYIGKRTVVYGLFGDCKREYDKNGLTERLVIFQESGMFAGAPPSEMRINCFVPFDDINFGRQWCAKLNRNADLPYYLGKVKIRTANYGDKITDKDLESFGLQPLADTLPEPIRLEA